MNAKRRLEALEAVLGHRRAPSWDEFNAASERISRRARWKVESFLAEHGLIEPPTEPPPGGDEAEDSAIVRAYEAAHNIPREDPEEVKARFTEQLEGTACAIRERAAR